MKTLRIIGTALVAVVLGAGLCACSDDDDDDASSGGSAPSADISVINATDGDRLLLTSIKDSYGNVYYKFGYDEHGRCTYIEGDGCDYEISYNPYKIVITANDEFEQSSFTFNGSGYATKISCSVSEKGSGWEYGESATVSISYDGDHPTKVTESWSGREVEDGDRYTYSGSATATLTWKDGNMTKMSLTYKESDSDGDDWSGTCSYTYKYGDTDNECRQHTMALNEAYWVIDFMEDLGFIGYFGKGTSNLPTSCEVVWKEDGYTDTDSFTSSYTKNSNGTIKTEKTYGITYTYSYSTLDSYTRSAVTTPFDDMFVSSEKADKHNGKFGMRHGRHGNLSQHRLRNISE